MKNIIIVLIYLFISPQIAFGENNQDIKAYVNEVIAEGYAIVQDPKLSSEQKFNKSSEVIRANLHLDWMAKYTLGRNKRTLSAEKLKEFINVYSQFVVNAYADLSRHYNGEKATVKMIKPLDNNMFIVNMEIAKIGSSSPIKVDYLIHKIDDDKQRPFRVADVITEGVSILNSQQSEFNSVITSHGIDTLISELQNKVNNKKKQETEKKASN